MLKLYFKNIFYFNKVLIKMHSESFKYKLFDIAANLCDEKFKGIYNGKKYHEDDTDDVILRAKNYNVEKMLFASGCLDDTADSYNLALKSEHFYTTIGVHPCRAAEAEATKIEIGQYFDNMRTIYSKYKDKIIAIGECGLDYDRLHYSPKDIQLKFYPPHFDLAKETGLPMYLHSRNTDDDFYRITKENRHKFSTGVVHSFTESEEVLNQYLSLDLYIGVNGCSLKLEENLEVVKKIPLDRIMIETDAPYCDIRPTHASYKFVNTQFKDKVKKEKMKKGLICKDRNEPCLIVYKNYINFRQVLEVVAKLKGVSEEELAKISYENTLKMFNIR